MMKMTKILGKSSALGMTTLRIHPKGLPLSSIAQHKICPSPNVNLSTNHAKGYANTGTFFWSSIQVVRQQILKAGSLATFTTWKTP